MSSSLPLDLATVFLWVFAYSHLLRYPPSLLRCLESVETPHDRCRLPTMEIIYATVTKVWHYDLTLGSVLSGIVWSSFTFPKSQKLSLFSLISTSFYFQVWARVLPLSAADPTEVGSVTCQRGRIQNYLGNGPSGKPVVNCLDCFEVTRPSHYGWHHSMARILGWEKRREETKPKHWSFCYVATDSVWPIIGPRQLQLWLSCGDRL